MSNNSFKDKVEIMNAADVKRAVGRMAVEIVERNRGTEDMVIIGIQKRGVLLARAIANAIYDAEGIKLPLGSLDITFYRDDLTRLSEHPTIVGNDIAFSVEDKRIILVDDVLYTGRSIRAAIGELFDMGRPAKVELAILIDRGHREVPIRADYIGREVPTANNERINMETDENGDIVRVSIAVKEEKHS